MRDLVSRNFFLKTGLPLLAFAAFIFLFFINSRVDSEERWHSLLVLSPEKLDETEFFLQNKAIHEVISSNRSVVYNDFLGLNEIPLNRLSDRLLFEDWRFDPVLKELSALFITEKGERIFFLSNRSPYEMLFALWDIKENTLWEQKGGILFFSGPLIYFFLGISLIGLYGKSCLYPLIIFFSWFPFLYTSSSQWGIIAPSLIVLEISLFEGYPFKKYQLPVLSSLILSGAVSILTGHGFQLIIQVILSLIIVFSIKFGQRHSEKTSLSQFRSSKRFIYLKKKTEHTLFEPVFFNKKMSMHRSNGFKSRARGKSLILLVPFTLILLIPFPVNRINHLDIPHPESIREHLDYQKSLLYRQNWDSENKIMEYNWERNTGKIMTSTLDLTDKQEPMAILNSNFIYSFFLNPLMLDGSIGYFMEQHFIKYIIFTIITVFFLYTVLFLFMEYERRDKLFFTSNRRGRKVA